MFYFQRRVGNGVANSHRILRWTFAYKDRVLGFAVYKSIPLLACWLIAFPPGPFSSRATAQETLKSIPSIRLSQRQHPNESHSFSIQGRLVFCAPLWNRFRIQDSESSVWCIGAREVRSVIDGATIGDEFLLTGVVEPKKSILTIQSATLIHEGGIDDLRFHDALVDGAPVRWKFVRHEGTVSEVFSTPVMTRLLLKEMEEDISVVLYGDHMECDFSALPGQRIAALGYLEVDDDRQDAKTNSLRILAMSPEQIQPLDNPPSPAPLAPPIEAPHLESVVIEARIDYVAPTYVIAGKTKIATHAWSWIQPGDGAVIRLVDLDQQRQTARAIELEILASKPRDAPPRANVDQLSQGQHRYERVTTTGTVIDSEVTDLVTTLRLKSGETIFAATVARTNARQDPGYHRAGTRLQLTGLIQPVDSSSPGSPGFQMRVNSLDDIRVENSGLVISPRWMWLIGGAAATLTAIVSMWFFTLKQTVVARTSELRSLNARVLAATHSVRDAILVFDVDGKVTLTDEKLKSMFGVEIELGAEREEVLTSVLLSQRTDSGVLKEFQGFREYWTDAFKSQTFVDTREFAIGNGRWLSVYTAPVQQEQRYFGRIWTLDDITARKQQEAEQLHARKINAIGRLAGGIAHDFNNLLMVVDANLTACQSEPQSEDARQRLETANRAVDRAAELTQQLLAFSRRSSVETVAVDVTRLLEETESFLRSTIDSRLKLEVSAAPDCGCVRANAAQLQQVLINLCQNSRDALEERGATGHIRLTASPVLDPQVGKCVKMVIEDNGPGMPEEVLEQIFEPFYTTKPMGQGTGLGMAMALGVAEQLGGRIECHSRVNEGTRVELILPHTELSVLSGKQAPPPKASSLNDGEFARKRVLLIDDNSAVLEAGMIVVTQLGCDAEMANSGEAALDLIRQDDQFDLILVDYLMPKMTGVETMKAIRQLAPNIPVVICSGYSDAVSMDSEAQPDGLLPKPFRVQTLLDLIESLCGPNQDGPAHRVG